MIIKAFNIKYDTDGDVAFAETLPKEITFSCFNDIDEVESGVADAISDETGFCIFSCDYIIDKGTNND